MTSHTVFLAWQLWSHRSRNWLQTRALLHSYTGCVTWGRVLNLSELHFLQLRMELLGLNEVMLKNGLKTEPGQSASSFLIQILPEWPGNWCDQKLGRALSSAAPGPHTPPLGGVCGLVDGMTQIKTQFSRSFLPKVLTFYLFKAQRQSRPGRQVAQQGLPRKGNQDFQVTCLPTGTGEPKAGAVQPSLPSTPLVVEGS